MKKTAIIYEWIEEGKDYQKEVDRKAFYSMFEGLAKGFGKIGDNEISKKLVKVIPKVDKICINKDLNDTQDVPSIICTTNGTRNLIKIMRRHVIVWSILNKYCTK